MKTLLCGFPHKIEIVSSSLLALFTETRREHQVSSIRASVFMFSVSRTSYQCTQCCNTQLGMAECGWLCPEMFAPFATACELLVALLLQCESVGRVGAHFNQRLRTDQRFLTRCMQERDRVQITLCTARVEPSHKQALGAQT